MHQIVLRLGLYTTPAEGAHSAPPDLVAGFKGPTSKRTGGRENEESGKGRGEEGERGWRRGRDGYRRGKGKGKEEERGKKEKKGGKERGGEVKAIEGRGKGMGEVKEGKRRGHEKRSTI